MAKNLHRYVCSICATVYPKWVGKCDSCGNWNSIEESNEEASPLLFRKSKNIGSFSSKPIEFTDFKSKEKELLTYKTSIGEFDRVCGGGITESSVILIGGEPGIGKSTLIMQILSKLSENHKCIYISGEETTSQLKRRAERLNIHGMKTLLANETSLDNIILSLTKEEANILIIDSIQTIYTENLDSLPGSINQIKTCATELINFCKKNNICLIMIGHITRDGQIAGPKALEHMVDTVLYFEGENNNNFRILSSVKNRFGPSGEIGVFNMGELGLEEVSNPSSLFLNDYKELTSGTTVFASMEGSRSILAEIQSLIVDSSLPSPRRSVNGIDINRLHMLLAVLETKYKTPLKFKDVYINIMGGLKINDTAIDLAIIASLLSSLKRKPIKGKSVFIGEVSLSGQIRNVFNLEKRIQAADKLGFNTIFIPKISMKNKTIANLYKTISINVVGLDNIIELEKYINE